MIFKTMPQNGASWLKPLLYSLEFEQSEERVEVEIYDELTASTMGKILLYNTSYADIDIAPYIRTAKLNMPLVKQTAIVEPSQDACRVVLRVNGEESSPILLFRSEITGLAPRMISAIAESGTVAEGETIRFTLLAENSIILTIAQSSNGSIKRYQYDVQGVPSEVALPIVESTVGTNIIIRVECDGVLLGVCNYRVVARDDSAVRLAWINALGGVECHTFPQSIRRSVVVKSEDVEGECGWYRRVVGSTIVRRLLLSGATQSEIDSIVDILLSPRVYRCDSDEDRAVQLLTDTITYDDHGKLRRLEFDIKEEWKGGVL